jgi:hypothetical protein
MVQVHDLTVGYVSGMIAAGLFVGTFNIYAVRKTAQKWISLSLKSQQPHRHLMGGNPFWLRPPYWQRRMVGNSL